MSAWTYTHHMHSWCLTRLDEGLDLLELELEMAVSYHMDDQDWTWLSKSSYPSPLTIPFHRNGEQWVSPRIKVSLQHSQAPHPTTLCILYTCHQADLLQPAPHTLLWCRLRELHSLTRVDMSGFWICDKKLLVKLSKFSCLWTSRRGSILLMCFNKAQSETQALVTSLRFLHDSDIDLS